MCILFLLKRSKKVFFQEVLPETQRAFPPLTKTQISFSDKKRTKNTLTNFGPFSLDKHLIFELKIEMGGCGEEGSMSECRV
jgi:hypothetical protein